MKELQEDEGFCIVGMEDPDDVQLLVDPPAVHSGLEDPDDVQLLVDPPVMHSGLEDPDDIQLLIDPLTVQPIHVIKRETTNAISETETLTTPQTEEKTSAKHLLLLPLVVGFLFIVFIIAFLL
jgi:hypothetical protein